MPTGRVFHDTGPDEQKAHSWAYGEICVLLTHLFFFFFFFLFFAKLTGRTVRKIWINDGSKVMSPLR